MSRNLALVSLAAVSLGLAGCGSKPAEQPTADTSVAANESASANDTMPVVPGAPALSGQDFANAAAASDNFEKATSLLVQRKGSDKAVKDFAAMMVKAHTESTAKIKKAAGEANPKITPDPTLDAEMQTKLDALGKLTGAVLDKQYAADQVAAHEKTLATMKSYAESGDVPSLKSAAAEIAPIVASHLDMAKALPK
jgi:putative membrane protein